MDFLLSGLDLAGGIIPVTRLCAKRAAGGHPPRVGRLS